MNRLNLLLKDKIIAIFCVLIALVGGIFIYFYISSLKTGEAIKGDFNEVLVAKDYIEAGTIINSEMVEKQIISRNIFSDMFVVNIEEILSKKTKEKINKGEIISRDKFEDFDVINNKKITFSTYIPANKKAVTIPVTFYGDTSLLNIGDKVDVISTFYDDKAGEIKSQNILSSKEIILMSGNFDYKMDNQTENINNQKQNSFSFLDFSEGDINSLDGLKLYITFYLTGEEAESIFKSLEYGNLNLAICSSRGF